VRIALAVVFGLIILWVGLTTLRGLARPKAPSSIEPVEAPPAGTRVVFWCETCGLELALVRAGSPNPPRHCGEPMTRREEILRG
jgi:hypothetical protein